MKIIFLDFDGVLNSQRYMESDAYGTGKGLAFGHSQIDPKAVELLNKMIDVTDARVVISSSWRHIWSRDEIGRMLKQRGFRHPSSIIDITPSLMSQRGDEIAQWLGQADEGRRIGGEKIDGYVILDDSTDMHPDQMEHFVQTNPDTGLTSQDVNRAISILGI